jgi:hypothetical protein
MRHLSEGEIQAYVRGLATAADLLAADDHLAACEACRGRAASEADAGGALVRSAVLPIASHFSDEQVQVLAGGGSVSDSERRAMDDHLGACATCRRAVVDLRSWSQPRLAAGRRLGYAAAAAAVVLAIVVPLALRDRTRAPEHAAATVEGLELLPLDHRRRVEDALRAGRAEPPVLAAELRSGREALMGDPRPPSFAVTAPVGIFIISDRPTFRWTPLTAAERYTVLVTDAEMRPVKRSPPLTGTSWTPNDPLPRAATYSWQVTASRGGEDVAAAPAPPEPQARFHVVDAETASVLQRAATERPDAHLLRGILYTQAGLLDEARRELEAVGPGDPHAATARETLRALAGSVPRN